MSGVDLIWVCGCLAAASTVGFWMLREFVGYVGLVTGLVVLINFSFMDVPLQIPLAVSLGGMLGIILSMLAEE